MTAKYDHGGGCACGLYAECTGPDCNGHPDYKPPPDPRDAEIARLTTEVAAMREALTAMVDRWEPDTSGIDRVMWENARAALGAAP